MEQIAENTADSLTESVKEVNQFTQYFQGKMPGLMDLGIKLVIVLIAFFVCRKIIQLILKIFGRSFERAGMEAASAHFTLSIMKAIMYVMVVAVMATFLGVSGASVAALIGSMGVGVVARAHPGIFCHAASPADYGPAAYRQPAAPVAAGAAAHRAGGRAGARFKNAAHHHPGQR